LASLGLAAVLLLGAHAAPAVGSFAPKVDYPVGNGPVGVAAGAFDRDGKRDLAVTNLDDADVSVLLNEP